jgi:hypothetical protein
MLIVPLPATTPAPTSVAEAIKVADGTKDAWIFRLDLKDFAARR